MVSLQMAAQTTTTTTTTNAWQNTNNEAKPWTRWWWMGSAVDKHNIKNHLVQFQKAGLGGVEITPIYGVKGEEANFLEFWSPEYLEVLSYTIKTADSLGLGVDMVLGTGWPYGGKQVNLEDAASKLVYKKIDIKKGEKFEGSILPEKAKHLTLQAVMAFSSNKAENITAKVTAENTIKWKAKKGDYTIYALFLGKTGQQVKRAAPGGKGYTLDHFSHKALQNYVSFYHSAFANMEERPTTIFNDSYEVYGTTFTPDFLAQFEKRRGYSLLPHLNQLLLEEPDDIANRIKSDFRETISDILLEEFDRPWTKWANGYGMKTRLQAHGSPGNLIDLYASADIPECETFGSMPFDIPGYRRDPENIRKGDANPIMLKFSSSAAHISGKPLTSSESFTWLREHFKTALSHTKPEAEELFLNGVNHLFLHGSTYSPERAAWPGWKFYASVNFSPQNTIWADADAMFSYVKNVQTYLQKGTSDNEHLVYWPIHDVWNSYFEGKLFVQLKIHSLEEWLLPTNFYKLSTNLIEKGYTIDFISDRFIEEAKVVNGEIQLPGGTFKSIIIPKSKFIPLATMRKLQELKAAGGNIIFEGLPASVPGFFQYEKQNSQLQQLLKEVSVSEDVLASLAANNNQPETLVTTGLKFIRRSYEGGKIYYLVNHTAKKIDTLIPLNTNEKEVLLLDPLTEKVGKAKVVQKGNQTFIKLQLASGDAIIAQSGDHFDVAEWTYFEEQSKQYAIEGNWELTFENGGPTIPESIELSTLTDWTKINEETTNFSGTGVYTISFENPDASVHNWNLDLGNVRESAEVYLNGEYLQTLWSVPFTLQLSNLKEGTNQLTIKVTNLAANRLRAKEMRGEEWKNFYEINMVTKDYQKFDATLWKPMPSGLLSTINLIPLKEID